MAGCSGCDSRVYLDPWCVDFSDYLLGRRGRLSDFVFRVDVRGVVWVAAEARLASFFEYFVSVGQRINVRQEG